MLLQDNDITIHTSRNVRLVYHFCIGLKFHIGHKSIPEIHTNEQNLLSK